MSAPFRIALAGVVMGLFVTPVQAEKLDKKHKAWLEEVAPLMLPDEEKQFRDMKKGDRDEFVKIFWKRRDPDMETDANEYQTEFEKARAAADERFKVFGRAGSETDCGRVFILLGEPDELKAEGQDVQPGQRRPETWVYRDRLGFRFPDGSMQLPFNAECGLPQGARAGELMKDLAESRIVNPSLSYSYGSDGRLVSLVDMLPKPSPAQTLLKTPRQDFELAAHPVMVLKTEGGGYVAGLLRGDASGLKPQDVGDRKMLKLMVAIQAVDAEGKVAAVGEREALAELSEDGRFTVSYGVAVRPGEYTLKVGALDPDSGQGSLVSVPLSAPDYPTGRLSSASLLVLHDAQETPAGSAPDNSDALRDFALGGLRLIPSFENRFTKQDSFLIFCPFYGATTDEAGKANVAIDLAVYRGAKRISQAPPQTFEIANPIYGVGPVPLAGFEPGSYTVKAKAKDERAGTELELETSFEVVGDAPAAAPQP